MTNLFSLNYSIIYFISLASILCGIFVITSKNTTLYDKKICIFTSIAYELWLGLLIIIVIVIFIISEEFKCTFVSFYLIFLYKNLVKGLYGDCCHTPKKRYIFCIGFRFIYLSRGHFVIRNNHFLAPVKHSGVKISSRSFHTSVRCNIDSDMAEKFRTAHRNMLTRAQAIDVNEGSKRETDFLEEKISYLRDQIQLKDNKVAALVQDHKAVNDNLTVVQNQLDGIFYSMQPSLCLTSKLWISCYNIRAENLSNLYNYQLSLIHENYSHYVKHTKVTCLIKAMEEINHNRNLAVINVYTSDPSCNNEGADVLNAISSQLLRYKIENSRLWDVEISLSQEAAKLDYDLGCTEAREISKWQDEREKQSLVNDFADPATEMPSYMDPEE